MAKNLTAASVSKIKPTGRRQQIADGLVGGLSLLVQPSGTKSWNFRYRVGDKQRRMALGEYPTVSLADARTRAREIKLAILEGDDPAAIRSEKKAARAAGRDRVAAIFETYADRHLATLKSGKITRRELERHMVAVWGERDIGDISRRDVIELLEGIAASGRAVTSNRVRAYLSKFFSWCVDREILDASPVTGVKPLSKETSRDRVLTDDEIRWFWKACDQWRFPWGHLGQLLLLTGQRLGEVTGMTETEIRGDLWCLPPERTKNGRAHDVPLSGAALAILRETPRIGGAGLYFTTTGTTPLSGFDKGRQHIADTMEAIAAEEQGAPVSIPRWTFHDLRRTCATGMARLSVSVRVTEAVLNHVSGTGAGIVGVYQRHDFAGEKRAALDAWANFVTELVDGRAENVVRLTDRKL